MSFLDAGKLLMCTTPAKGLPLSQWQNKRELMQQLKMHDGFLSRFEAFLFCFQFYMTFLISGFTRDLSRDSLFVK